MGGWWPFKRKEPEEQGQEVIEYELGGENQASQTMEDRSHIEEKTYQNALSLLSSPHLGAPEAGDVAPSKEISDETSPETGSTTPPEADSTTPPKADSINPDAVAVDDMSNWLNHTDGYWYRKDGTGGFEATAHTKKSDGTFTPYNA
jgi:hypothetical protein